MKKVAFQKVLVANRSEVVSRIARTCHALNISVIGIYTEVCIYLFFVFVFFFFFLGRQRYALFEGLRRHGLCEVVSGW
jgi:hypothetical protein